MYMHIDFHIYEAGGGGVVNKLPTRSTLWSDDTYLDQFVSPHNIEFRSKY